MDDKTLLLLDREGPLRRALAEQMASFGYTVAQTGSGGEAATRAGRFDMLVVASVPPESDPLALCDVWCNAGAAILVLTDDATPTEPLKAAGALTLPKPVRLADLARLLKDALRATAAPPFSVGSLRFQPATRELTGERGNAVRLTEKEAAILAYLHKSGPRAVPRDELLAQLWGYADTIATHTLETHIYRLRRKLEGTGDADALRLISDGTGYRLTASGPDAP